jgi:hypothetical protein
MQAAQTNMCFISPGTGLYMHSCRVDESDETFHMDYEHCFHVVFMGSEGSMQKYGICMLDRFIRVI